MRSLRKLAAAAPALAFALTLAPARDAGACGGYFGPPGQSTEVASHRMAFSVSSTQSTLWDQIQYSGAPADFAWVLPYKGTIQVGVSSDLLFEQLDQLTAVTVTAPVYCACSFGSSDFESSSASGGAFDAGGVTVIAQMAVGPYDTVQLSSSDPTALTAWLTMNGYDIPPAIDPTIAAYVAEGFDFLALRLAPGMGVAAMQPVRVTTPGAGLSLPLRMVAAGVATSVPITLYVLAEGRYEPTSFPTFTIAPSQVVWDFATNTSNYAALRQAGFTATMNEGWLVESTGPMAEQAISGPILSTAMFDPMASGYADSMGDNAPQNATADLDVLFSGIDMTSFWFTRLFAQLPVGALTTDLALGASADQSSISTNIGATHYVNPPPCPCATGSGGMGGAGGAPSGSSTGAGGAPNGSSAASGSGAHGSTAGAGGGEGPTSFQSGCGGCNVGGATGAPAAFGGILAALALAGARRRKRGPG